MKKVVEFYKEYPVDESKECIKLCNDDVDRIEYHEPQGEGDAHYCDVYYTNGYEYRVFKPDSILFSNDKEVQNG